MNAADALSRLRAKKAPEPPKEPSRGYVTFEGIEALPEPPVCPECRGRCCRDDLGYPLAHLNWDVGEHWCEHCADGTAPAPGSSGRYPGSSGRYPGSSGRYPVMGIYLLTQTAVRGYDTYDSCIVVAASPEEARRIHPRGDRVWDGRRWTYSDGLAATTWASSDGGWVSDIEAVTATLVGVAHPTVEPGVVCASFNAG